jgi:hypothetical protein
MQLRQAGPWISIERCQGRGRGIADTLAKELFQRHVRNPEKLLSSVFALTKSRFCTQTGQFLPLENRRRVEYKSIYPV